MKTINVTMTTENIRPEKMNKLQEIYNTIKLYGNTIIDMDEEEEVMHLISDLQAIMEE